MSFITGTLPSRALARRSCFKGYTYYSSRQTPILRHDNFQGIYTNIYHQSGTPLPQDSTMNPDLKPIPPSKWSVYFRRFFYGGIVAIIFQWMWFLEREPITGRWHYVSLSPGILASVAQAREFKDAKNCRIPPGHPTARAIESISFRLNAAAGISNKERVLYFINAPSTLLLSTLGQLCVR